MLIAFAFALVGVIHLLPIGPVFAPGLLGDLYGIEPQDTTLLVLMRHRALLLGGVGALCLAAAALPALRLAALGVAGIGVAGFLAFYALYDLPTGSLRRIAIADLVAVPPLVFAAWQLALSR